MSGLLAPGRISADLFVLGLNPDAVLSMFTAFALHGTIRHLLSGE